MIYFILYYLPLWKNISLYKRIKTKIFIIGTIIYTLLYLFINFKSFDIIANNIIIKYIQQYIKYVILLDICLLIYTIYKNKYILQTTPESITSNISQEGLNTEVINNTPLNNYINPQLSNDLQVPNNPHINPYNNYQLNPQFNPQLNPQFKS